MSGLGIAVRKLAAPEKARLQWIIVPLSGLPPPVLINLHTQSFRFFHGPKQCHDAMNTQGVWIFIDPREYSKFRRVRVVTAFVSSQRVIV
ncbi:MAG: hypothetical protein NVS1B11_24360 [Terriglobales bacterium]